MTETTMQARRGWPLTKRVLHWALALCVVVALIAPKPEDGGGSVHIAAGSLAAALVAVRVFWRLLGDIRPRVRDALKVSMPSVQKLGMRALAPPASQVGRLFGFAFLALIPIAAALGVLGVQAGEDSATLEAHEAAGTAILILAIAHAALVVIFSLIGRFDVLGVTLWRQGPLTEGGARGAVGLLVGAMVAVAALAYVWGPFDIAARVASLEEGGASIETGRHAEDDD